MNDLVTYLSVFLAAAIPWLEVLVVVPAGILAGLPAVPVMVVAAIGNLSTLVPLVLFGDRLRAWWRRRRGRAEDERAPSGRNARARSLLDRYGVPGLAALGPLLTGVHVAALVALATGAERRRTLLWLSGGVVLWALISGAAALIGLDVLVDPASLPDLEAATS